MNRWFLLSLVAAGSVSALLLTVRSCGNDVDRTGVPPLYAPPPQAAVRSRGLRGQDPVPQGAGVVVDVHDEATGLPVASAWVELGGVELAPRGQTDADGRVRLAHTAGLDPELPVEATVTVEADEYERCVRTVSLSRAFEQVSLRLSGKARIAGRVIVPGRADVPADTALRVWTSEGRPLRRTVEVAPSGSFVVDGLGPLTTYSIRATAPGHEAADVEGITARAAPAEPPQIELRLTRRFAVAVDLAGAGPQDCPRLRVALVNERGDAGDAAPVYWVEEMGLGRANPVAPIASKRIVSVTVTGSFGEVVARQPVNVELGADLPVAVTQSPIPLQLAEHAVTLEFDPGAVPPADAWLLWQANGRTGTLEDAATTKTMRLWRPLSSDSFRLTLTFNTGAGAAVDIPAEHVARFAARPEGTLEVVMPAGVERTIVVTLSKDPARPVVERTARSTFTIGLAPGRYDVRASGLETVGHVEIAAGATSKLVLDDLAAAASLHVKLPSPGPPAAERARVRIRVVRYEGDESIVAYTARWPAAKADLDVDGLAPGEWSVEAELDGVGRSRQTVQLTAGRSASLEMPEWIAPGTAVITILDEKGVPLPDFQLRIFMVPRGSGMTVNGSTDDSGAIRYPIHYPGRLYVTSQSQMWTRQVDAAAFCSLVFSLNSREETVELTLDGWWKDRVVQVGQVRGDGVMDVAHRVDANHFALQPPGGGDVLVLALANSEIVFHDLPAGKAAVRLADEPASLRLRFLTGGDGPSRPSAVQLRIRKVNGLDVLSTPLSRQGGPCSPDAEVALRASTTLTVFGEGVNAAGAVAWRSEDAVLRPAGPSSLSLVLVPLQAR